MPDFAVYYVPPAAHPLYQVGSDLLGYDLRAEKLLPTATSARSAFPDFTLDWVRDSQQYGFHMTIGHAMHYEAEKLASIEAEIAAIMNLFDPKKPRELMPCSGTAYVSLAPQWACLLRYDANQALLMLHALVVARISPLSSGTPQLKRFLSGERMPALHGQHRLTQYYYEYILDDFYPHFTLFNPLPVADIEPVRAAVMATVPEPQPLTVDTLCLLVRPDGDTHYRIHREFSFADFPQPITVITS